MHGAWDGGRIVGGAGAFTFDVSVPGGKRVPCAGVTVSACSRRPPPRRDDGDDARAARRHPPPRRAARLPLGVRGNDLRPVRLRARLAGLDRRCRRSGRRSREPFEPRGSVRFVTRPRRSKRSRRSTSGCATPAGHVLARAGRGGRRGAWPTIPPGAGRATWPVQLALLELDGEPAGYAMYRVAPGIDERHHHVQGRSSSR